MFARDRTDRLANTVSAGERDFCRAQPIQSVAFERHPRLPSGSCQRF